MHKTLVCDSEKVDFLDFVRNDKWLGFRGRGRLPLH